MTRTRIGRLARLGALIALVAGHLAAAAQDPARGAALDPAESARHGELMRLGERLYREGRSASGAPLQAVGAAGARLEGKDAACVTCHRRSGYGSTEGRTTVRPIIGPALLQVQTTPVHTPRVKARLGTSRRAPYDEKLLVRALRDGLDASGRPLEPVMPRYVLDADDARALAAYLFALSAEPSPGVDEHEIHFATVIQPGVAPEQRRAMLAVMEAFIKDKDANMRLDERRREAGNMRMYRSYRKWVLHVWELSGPAETWAGQLESHYQRQPVFALLGGLGAASWHPIHAFSERFEVPCVFPLAEWPDLGAPNHYTFYLSRGPALEAEVLARFLRDRGRTGRIVQVFRRGAAGDAGAAALRAVLAGDAALVLDDLPLDALPPADLWRSVNDRAPASVVLWLDAADLAALPARGDASGAAVYLSSTLLGHRIPAAALRTAPNPRLVWPSDLAPHRDARLLRNKVWLHGKGLPLTDEAVQVNTQFLMAVVSDVLGHLMDSFSRDYFVERIEHTAGQTPTGSIFQSVSLGPGQRFAAKGASVVEIADRDVRHLKPLSAWIVP